MMVMDDQNQGYDCLDLDGCTLEAAVRRSTAGPANTRSTSRRPSASWPSTTRNGNP